MMSPTVSSRPITLSYLHLLTANPEALSPTFAIFGRAVQSRRAVSNFRKPICESVLQLSRDVNWLRSLFKANPRSRSPTFDRRWQPMTTARLQLSAQQHEPASSGKSDLFNFITLRIYAVKVWYDLVRLLASKIMYYTEKRLWHRVTFAFVKSPFIHSLLFERKKICAFHTTASYYNLYEHQFELFLIRLYIIINVK